MIPSLNLPAFPALPFAAFATGPVVGFDTVLEALPVEAPASLVSDDVELTATPAIDPDNLGQSQNIDRDESKPTVIDEPTAALLRFLGIHPQKSPEIVGGAPLQDDKHKPVDASPALPAPELSPEPVVTAPQRPRDESNTPIPESGTPAKAGIHQRKGSEGVEPRPRVGDEEPLALSNAPEKPDDRVEVEGRPDDVVVALPATDRQPPATLSLPISITLAPIPPVVAKPNNDYSRTIPDTVDRQPPSRKPYEIKPKPIVITLPPEKAEEPAPAITLAALGVKEAPQIAAPLAPNILQAAAINAPAVATADPIHFVVERQLDLARDTRWLDELARDIVSVGERSDRLSFRLMPAQLGRLDVDVSTSDSGLSVRIATTSDAAAQIVTAAQPRLIDELKGQGVRIAGTEVSSGGTQSQGQGQQHQQQHGAEHMIEYARRAFGAIDDTNLTRPSGRFA